MTELRAGFALCGSFCTFDKVMPEICRLKAAGIDLTPIMSEKAFETDTRFGSAAEWADKIAEICEKPVIHTIQQAEPIGPNRLLDILIVAPCTGNTIGKLAAGITDTCVTMACKAHLRGGKPIVLAPSTNDGLSGAAKNIGELLARKNVYFVPFRQDDPKNKPFSIASDMKLIAQTVEYALRGEQLQPILLAD
ncbi:MAG: dipicolinate synthase subunit B [Oscillospiraceae bacterium]|jgi:dipicolinate synthase subunit B|nr:dipicolinate synthase subunit B [Oscillospiraceae bacterium]